MERSAGGVVFYWSKSGEPLYLLMSNPHGTWEFPKGHVMKGESDEEAALREVKEETGAIGEVVRKLGVIRYQFTANNGTIMNRIVHFYLMRLKKQGRFIPNAETESYRWVSFEEAMKLLAYESEREIVRKAFRYLER